MKSYRIHLIRHGMTEANEKGLYIGRTDLPLSAYGLADLLDKKEKANYPYAERIYTSPMMRCRQTLNVLYPDREVIVKDDLRECDFGDWENRTAAELQYDETFTQWIAGESAEIPNGEGAAAFQQRVMNAFAEIVMDVMKDKVNDTVVCAHGGVIMCIMAAFALPRADMSAWKTESGCGFTLRVTPSLWMRDPVAVAIGYVPRIEKE